MLSVAHLLSSILSSLLRPADGSSVYRELTNNRRWSELRFRDCWVSISLLSRELKQRVFLPTARRARFESSSSFAFRLLLTRASSHVSQTFLCNFLCSPSLRSTNDLPSLNRHLASSFLLPRRPMFSPLQRRSRWSRPRCSVE